MADIRQGLATGDNSRFLRFWPEVSQNALSLDCGGREEALGSGKKWFPYNKGGAFRKWFGNAQFVINWSDDGHEIRHLMGDNGRLRSRPQNMAYYFRECISWSKVTIGAVAFRSYPKGFVFDVAGCSLFPHANLEVPVALGFLNSCICTAILGVLSPTMNYEVGHIERLPIEDLACFPELPRIRSGAVELVAIARADWNSSEVSWDFAAHPLLLPEVKGATLEASWHRWEDQCAGAVRRMQQLETDNNRLFIDAYGLAGELEPAVDRRLITLSSNPAFRFKKKRARRPAVDDDSVPERVNAFETGDMRILCGEGGGESRSA